MALQILLPVAGLALLLVVAGFFASNLARNFLQAAGYASATLVICSLSLGALLNGRGSPYNQLAPESLFDSHHCKPCHHLHALIWLAWLNFKSFHENWHLWRRNILSLASAFVFIAVISPAIYNRAWEYS